MNIRLLIALVIVLFSYNCPGQNLVPNGDFEAYNNCPAAPSSAFSPGDGIAYSPAYTYFPTVQGWVLPLENSSADYFNACASGGTINVPNTFMGFHPAHSGKGYVGMYTYTRPGTLAPGANNYKEYVTCKLIQPLTAGTKYCLSFYASSGARNIPGPNYIAVDEIGASFTTSQPFDSIASVLHLPYQVKSTAGVFMTDTTKWYQVSGTFTATGGEEWMTIGCFRDTPAYAAIWPTPINPQSASVSYNFVDDVYLVPYQEYVAMHDTTICSLAGLSLSPDPAVGTFMWNTGDTAPAITVHDTGKFWRIAQSNCASYTDTFRIHYEALAAPVIKDTSICQNTINPILTAMPGSSLRWYTGPDDTIGSSGQPVIDTRNTGTIRMYAATEEGICKSKKTEVNISVLPYPVVDLGADINLCTDAPDSARFGTNQAMVTYQWNTGDTGCCIITHQGGTYILMAKNGCSSATDSVQINAYRCDNCIFLPNAFTPNGDGKNDQFRPKFQCPVTHYKMNIYNRWGQKIYTTTIPDAGWDGKQSGIGADMGTYMYSITYEHAATGKHYEAKGEIILVR